MKVFLCEKLHEKAYNRLKEKFEIIDDWNRIGEVDALINRDLHIYKEEIDKMPKLKVIAVHGTGTDGVDLEYAKQRNVKVVYAPHMNANAVAELNVALILNAMRKVTYADKVIRAGRKNEAISLLFGNELCGKTFGTIGFGAIGKRTAEILKNGFGMECIAYSPSLDERKAKEYGVGYVSSCDEILKNADVVSLNLPLQEATKHMINSEKLKLMKKTAVLVNCARGGLVCDDDLYSALVNEDIKAYACDVSQSDVFDKENKLMKLDNYIATPHIGANTDEALYTVGMACVEQIIDVLEGRKAQYEL